MVSLILLGIAIALLIVHMLDGRVQKGHVLAAFMLSAVAAVGDLREVAGQTCVTTTTTATAANPVGMPNVQTHPVTICTASYAVKVEALAALIASIGFAMLVLVLEMFDRLGRAASEGWEV